VSKSWLDQYIEWGLTRDEKPWTPSTAAAYKRELHRLEQLTGKPAEELNAEDLRAYQARHRGEPAATWNGRYHAIVGFYQFLGAQGFYQQLNAQGRRRSDPSAAISRRREEPKSTAPSVDVLAAITQMPDGRDKRIALFLYHSGLKIGEAESIEEPPVEGRVHVLRRGGRWEWVPVSDEALDLLSELGGRVAEPGLQKRNIQRRLPVTPSQIENAAKLNHQLRTSHGDALGPVWALLVRRSDLLDVARAYRDAVEAMEGPKPRPKSAITAAARALQAMLTAMGAKGNSLGPLFVSARSKELFGPHDAKLADALQSLVDWVSADRSERGDAHKDTDGGPEDAWLALRIVAALLLRLEATMAP
jgi:integrase